MISKRDASIIKLITIFCKFFKNPSKIDLNQLKEELETIEDIQIKKYGYFIWTLIKELVNNPKNKFAYSDIAKKTNKEFPQANFPEKGGALSRQSGSATGFASTISFNCANFLISAIVVSKNTNSPSEGLIKLANLLNISFNAQQEQNKIIEFFKKLSKEHK